MAKASLGEEGATGSYMTLLTEAARFHFQHLRWYKLAKTIPTYLIAGEEHYLYLIPPSTSSGFQLHHTCCFGFQKNLQTSKTVSHLRGTNITEPPCSRYALQPQLGWCWTGLG